MRILLTIHHALDRNTGAPGATSALAEALRRHGHSVRILSFDHLPRQWPARVQEVLFPFLVTAYVLRGAFRGTYDVIDASTGDAWLLLLLRNLFGGPVVVTRSHGLEHVAYAQQSKNSGSGSVPLSWRYRLYHGLIRLRQVAISVRYADAAMFLNQADRAYALQRLHVAAQRTVVVRNGIGSSFLGLPPPDASTDGDVVGFAFVGSYIYRKGIAYLEPAVEEVLREFPHTHLLLLGTGVAPETVLAGYSAEVQPRIRVVARFSNAELPQLIAGCMILLAPSLSEGFSLALVEGMACGLAPIVSRIPGPTEVIRDGVNGIIAPARDSSALAAALRRLLTDAPLFAAIRTAAWQTAQSYSWDAVCEDTLSVYRQAMARARRP